MTPPVDDYLKPSSGRQSANKLTVQRISTAGTPKRFQMIEAQAVKTLQAFERLDHSETKLKTSATQILLAILRYAATQDDPAG